MKLSCGLRKGDTTEWQIGLWYRKNQETLMVWVCETGWLLKFQSIKIM